MNLIVDPFPLHPPASVSQLKHLTVCKPVSFGHRSSNVSVFTSLYYHVDVRASGSLGPLKLRIKHKIVLAMGPRGSVVVKALCYKPEGRGFKS
jgi:hypothetical protein